MRSSRNIGKCSFFSPDIRVGALLFIASGAVYGQASKFQTLENEGDLS